MGQDLFDLTGRRALVTGSSQGIGFALARGLADAGAEIVLNGRDAAKLAEAARGLGGSTHQLAFDATDHEAVRAATWTASKRTIGAIDILVNNAGMQHRTPLEDFPADAFEQLMRTNISTVFNVGQAVARHMIKRGAGKIINIASVQTALGTSRHRALYGHQGRRRQSDQGHGDRLGEIRAAMQCHCTRLFRHAAERRTGCRFRLFRLAGKAHAGRPLGQSGRTGRRLRVPRLERILIS